MTDKFVIGETAIYIGKRIDGKAGKLCTIQDVMRLSDFDPVPYEILFIGDDFPHKWFVTEKCLLKYQPTRISPTVGGIAIYGDNPRDAQRIRFVGASVAMTEAYDALHPEWRLSHYNYIVTVHFHGNVTFVDVMIDSFHRVTLDTRALRVFHGVAICNESDHFDALIGLKTALHDAMDVGRHEYWNREADPKRIAIQKETWSLLRSVLNNIRVDKNTTVLSVISNKGP